jgi:hypothetical protein
MELKRSEELAQRLADVELAGCHICEDGNQVFFSLCYTFCLGTATESQAVMIT